MEKFIFLATIKDKLTEMNLPKEAVEKHVKTFEDCFRGKGAADIDKVINSAGGMNGILLSIYNLECTKKKDNNYIKPMSGNTSAPIQQAHADNAEQQTAPTPESTPAKASEQVDNNAATITIPLTQISAEKNEAEKTEKSESDTPMTSAADVAEEQAVDRALDLNEIFETPKETEKSASEDESFQDQPTIEIPASPEIAEHIKEAEEISETLERIPVPKSDTEVDYSELSDYDFEKLFEEKLSKPETWVKKLRSKMSDKTFKYTLPLAFIAIAILFIAVSALFPILLLSGIFCGVAYIASIVVGVCFAIIPIGYGVYMCFNSMPIALYELGIGIMSTGITMLTSILLYNYFKRLVPYLFKKLVKLFKLTVKVTKRYFKKPEKEEA